MEVKFWLSLCCLCLVGIGQAGLATESVSFETDAAALQSRYRAARQGLERNIRTIIPGDPPVLLEGAGYAGIWLECGPQEGLVYGMVRPRIAFESHQIFFRHQRDDGQLPYAVKEVGPGFGQIQMVVPIAATAWETYAQFGWAVGPGEADEFLTKAYRACCRWDGWLRRYRDTRQTGLCELFCGFDTGHDNSPRVTGLPAKCPGRDARRCPPGHNLPWLAPDLSATVYGGRLALTAMARALGRDAEATEWEDRAEQIRRAILSRCYDPKEKCFYDVDSAGKFIHVRGDALTRVLGEHVASKTLFDTIYATQIHNTQAFWTPYPFPSIAANDPAFVSIGAVNSWGGAAQALTALRAPRWLASYGKHADLTHMMQQWLSALTQADGFYQQINPWTGKFTPAGSNYSPAMLVILDFVARLYGVHFDGKDLHWNCLRPPGASYSRFWRATAVGPVELVRTGDVARLRLGNRQIAQIRGDCHVVTDSQGALHQLIGVATRPVAVTITRPGAESLRIRLGPDQISSIPQVQP